MSEGMINEIYNSMWNPSFYPEKVDGLIEKKDTISQYGINVETGQNYGKHNITKSTLYDMNKEDLQCTELYPRNMCPQFERDNLLSHKLQTPLQQTSPMFVGKERLSSPFSLEKGEGEGEGEASFKNWQIILFVLLVFIVLQQFTIQLKLEKLRFKIKSVKQ